MTGMSLDVAARLARLRDLPEPGVDVLVDGRLPDLYARKVYAVMGATVTDRGPHIREDAGINVALLECPPGRGVALHNHATAEVLMPLFGRWRFAWGERGEEGVELSGGDVFSVPVGVYRNFTNLSDTPALLFAVVQGDGVANAVKLAGHVVAEGRARGFTVDEDGRVLGNGLDFPPRTLEIPDLVYAREEVLRHVARFESLSARTERPGVEVLPVIGAAAPLRDRVGFELDFLRVAPGAAAAVGGERVHLLMPMVGGAWRLDLPGAGAASLELGPTDVFALPARHLGELRNAGDETALCLSLRGLGPRDG